MSTDAKPAYLVVLEGQGDAYVLLIDQATWDWINSDIPESAKGEGEWDETFLAPEAVRKAHAEYGDGVSITIGSYQNDRALAATEAALWTNHLGDASDVTDDIQYARRWAKDNGYEIRDTFNGGIY
jgi:hypothetical protein